MAVQGYAGFFIFRTLKKMAKLTTIEMTCDGQTIDLLTGSYSDQSIPKKGQTFSLQKNIDGEIKSPRYLVERVFVNGDKAHCDCSFIGYSA